MKTQQTLIDGAYKANAERLKALRNESTPNKAQHSPLPRLTEAEAKENMTGAYITLADGRTQYCKHLSERERKACNEYETLKAHADKLAEALRKDAATFTELKYTLRLLRRETLAHACDIALKATRETLAAYEAAQ